MAEKVVHDFSNEVHPKACSKVKSLIEGCEGDGPIEFVIPVDGGPRLRDMLNKKGWYIESESKDKHRLTVSVRKKD